MASAWGNSWGNAWGNSWGSIEVVALPPVAGVVEGGGFGAKAWSEDVGNLALIHQEDQVATELLVTLVTQGFFHGTFHS